MGTKDGGYSTAQHSKELLATTHDSAGDRGGGVGGDGGSQANANEQSLSVALP